MRVAVLGCGTMGWVHARSYAKLKEIQLVGVCDVDKEEADKLAAACGTTAYERFEEMLSEVCPDVVSICLPTPLHCKYTVIAAEAGVHVICEKPVSSTAKEAEIMDVVCRSNQVRLLIAHVGRFFPAYADVAQQVTAGVIGKPGVAHSRRIGPHPGLLKNWYNDERESGGVIMDLMIHDIDYMRSVLGEVLTVYAQRRTFTHLDYAWVTLKFDQGAIANLEGMWGYPGPFQTAMEFAGDQGVIRANSDETNSVIIRQSGLSTDCNLLDILDVTRKHEPLHLRKSPELQSAYVRELSHFIECIQSGSQPDVTFHDACMAFKIAQAAIESAHTGIPVNVKEYEKKGGFPV
ncbi:scyllo-inositol 2-dehydrogenase (NAD(+)) [Paenibacillus sp. JJ-100]|uniref:Gfo/Idh/MocA family protein n=1 Tax=Paenibacillus sp. JJ-100 TaxID=2974896 RepID=UPI0022FF87DE|nr:Gfo/Idh/MocA family oxidoreductase [Paenibacillus sp. JJ-100]CAI6048271.1 scyllo-inositol 2-dehydrogenase (NAD(+)) [Paenibacillus sp. JJ-100]